MEYEAADLELVGGDASKLDALLGKYEPDRVKARQAVIDQKDTQLRAFTALGLTPEQIAELKTQQPGESEKDVEKRIKDAIDAATKDLGSQADARSRAAEVRAQAAELGFIKPKQALALLDQTELAQVAVDENGEADSAAVKKLLEALATDSPHLVKNPDDETPGHQAAGVGATGSGGKPAVAPGVARIASAYEANAKKK